MPLDLTVNAATPVSLADFTQPSLLVPSLRERDTAGIISELSQLLQREGCIPDVLPFYHAALNRELLANSALSCGIAFPHARLSAVKQVRFAFGRAPEPVAWGPKGTPPVQFVFLLAVPATDSASYLHLIAGLARMGADLETLRGLRQAETSEQILSVLASPKLRTG